MISLKVISFPAHKVNDSFYLRFQTNWQLGEGCSVL